MIIRKYTHHDLDSVAILEKRAFDVGPYSKRYLRQILEDKDSTSIVSQIDARIVGYAVAIPMDRKKIDIESIAVDPDYSGMGIGHSMMASIESISLFRKYFTIVLEVREKNVKAISFYKSLGFKETEFIENYYSEIYCGSRNAFRMEKQIDQ
ncbi:MAG: ribosomal protein S18-alanine N-acetyltransferase [Thermoplasmata archaeon]